VENAGCSEFWRQTGSKPVSGQGNRIDIFFSQDLTIKKWQMQVVSLFFSLGL